MQVSEHVLPPQCRPMLVQLAEDLIRVKSPNPPGDVRAVMDVAERFLREHGLDHWDLVPGPGLRNIVARVDTGRPGPHLVMNAHLDVFPPNNDAIDAARTGRHEGRIYGRGAVDMKGGAAAFLMVLTQLARVDRKSVV